MANEQVNILLSSYNSASFLCAQLDSLLAQTHQSLHITIRDDGSSDDTHAILAKYANAYPQRITVVLGEHIGAAASFFRLLIESSDHSDYFAFCDHDDIWFEDKVAKAVQIMHKMPDDQPNLYCGRRICVDINLKEVGYSLLPTYVGYENALVENIVAGCTTLMNKAARRLLCQVIPKKMIMYDWWCYLVVSAFGHVHYDAQPYMLYRQHAGNLKGDTPLWYKRLWQRGLRLLRQRRGVYRISDQVAEFVHQYGEHLAPERRDMAQALLLARRNLATRIAYARYTPLRRQTYYDQRLLQLLITAGLY